MFDLISFLNYNVILFIIVPMIMIFILIIWKLSKRMKHEVEILGELTMVDVDNLKEEPWEVLGNFENGKIVRFKKSLESDKACPWCQNLLSLPDPYEKNKKGWVCNTCNAPHHLTCRKKSRQCCSEFCFRMQT